MNETLTVDFSIRCIFSDQVDHPICLHDLVQFDDVRMVECFENLNLSVDFR